MILGAVIALVIVVAMFVPPREQHTCDACGRDFDDEVDTQPEDN